MVVVCGVVWVCVCVCVWVGLCVCVCVSGGGLVWRGGGGGEAFVQCIPCQINRPEAWLEDI